MVCQVDVDICMPVAQVCFFVSPLRHGAGVEQLVGSHVPRPLDNFAYQTWPGTSLDETVVVGPTRPVMMGCLFVLVFCGRRGG